MASSASMGACCIGGIKHEGESIGEYKDVGGIKSYISYPENKSTKNAVLYLPDAFGFELVNNRLLADDFARAGYLTIIPDIFANKPVPFELLDNGGMATFDIMAWVGSHPPEKVDKIIEASIKGIKEELGVENIGAVGYCFGGRYVLRFLKEGENGGIDAGFVAHPSVVQTSEMEELGGALSIAAPENDQQLTPAVRHAWEEILLKKSNPYQIVLYGDCEHGFAVRTDLKDRKKKFAKESAYVQAVRWFDEWVKK